MLDIVSDMGTRVNWPAMSPLVVKLQKPDEYSALLNLDTTVAGQTVGVVLPQMGTQGSPVVGLATKTTVPLPVMLTVTLVASV